MKLDEKIKNILTGAVLTLAFATPLAVSMNYGLTKESKRQEILQAIDLNNDGKLSDKEVETFYTKEGVNPYTVNNLNSFLTENHKKYLGM